jgi:succinate dehydrogenase/fumarate reductase-like Fe-S protein
LRINNHPILGKESEIQEITIFFEGKEIPARMNEPIATALMNAGIKDFRYTKKKHIPRGVYCAIGRCTDCMMTVNGQANVRTCITRVEDRMVVERGKGF